MDLRKKKLLISALIASVLNAGSVLMCEFVFKSVRAEVMACSG